MALQFANTRRSVAPMKRIVESRVFLYTWSRVFGTLLVAHGAACSFLDGGDPAVAGFAAATDAARAAA
jgi:hypothetical protein